MSRGISSKVILKEFASLFINRNLFYIKEFKILIKKIEVDYTGTKFYLYFFPKNVIQQIVIQSFKESNIF